MKPSISFDEYEESLLRRDVSQVPAYVLAHLEETLEDSNWEVFGEALAVAARALDKEVAADSVTTTADGPTLRELASVLRKAGLRLGIEFLREEPSMGDALRDAS